MSWILLTSLTKRDTPMPGVKEGHCPQYWNIFNLITYLFYQHVLYFHVFLSLVSIFNLLFEEVSAFLIKHVLWWTPSAFIYLSNPYLSTPKWQVFWVKLFDGQFFSFSTISISSYSLLACMFLLSCLLIVLMVSLTYEKFYFTCCF